MARRTKVIVCLSSDEEYDYEYEVLEISEDEVINISSDDEDFDESLPTSPVPAELLQVSESSDFSSESMHTAPESMHDIFSSSMSSESSSSDSSDDDFIPCPPGSKGKSPATRNRERIKEKRRRRRQRKRLPSGPGEPSNQRSLPVVREVVLALRTENSPPRPLRR